MIHPPKVFANNSTHHLGLLSIFFPILLDLYPLDNQNGDEYIFLQVHVLKYVPSIVGKGQRKDYQHEEWGSCQNGYHYRKKK